MRVQRVLIASVLLIPASVSLSQESLCDPCVDPPANRSELPELPPLPERQDLRVIDFGTRVLTLLNSRRMSPRTQDERHMTEAEGVEAEASTPNEQSSEDSPDTEVAHPDMTTDEVEPEPLDSP